MTKVITRLQEITTEISNKLDIIQKESISVGSLLAEAREEFEASGKTYGDFIEYCGNEFNIGKAQASKLMKVAKFFKDDTRFKGVAMRVLYALATNGTPEHIERAAEFALNDSLSSNVLNQLLYPKPIEQVEPEVKKESKTDVLKQDKAVAEALASISEKKEEPVQDEALQSEMEELRQALRSAQELIKSLKNQNLTHNKPTLALLPQFSSSLPHVVLGLSEDESKVLAKVKKAFRALVKFGYGAGTEGFKIIEGAKDTLESSINDSK